MRFQSVTQWAMIEKANPLAVHALFMSREQGEQFLRDTVPLYCARGFYSDKSLVPKSFEITERPGKP